MARIAPQPGIMDIALYQSGQSHIAGHQTVLKLSSNENPWGPSPAAVTAIAEAAAGVHRYPSTDHASLRAAIAEVHGLPAEQILCGVGSDEILTFLCQAFAGPGDEVLYHEHGFSMYPILARAAGATPVTAPERDRTVDVDALLDAVTDRTRIVFLTNPGNPTGTLIGHGAMARLAEGLAGRALLVLDGAYAEFAEGYDGGAALVAAHDNVVMTRTFSKLYGLGGLRIGWGYAPQWIIDVLNRVRGPFNLSTVQLAAAEAAVRDRAFAEHCTAETRRLRAWLRGRLMARGIACDESHANFVLARFASPAAAEAADAHLKAEGILVRRVTGYGFPEGLRITIGTEADCARLDGALGRLSEAAA